MLPAINATRGLLPLELLASVVRRVRKTGAPGRLGAQAVFGEPSLARGAIFEQIPVGRINAQSLQTQPISLHALLEPVA